MNYTWAYRIKCYLVNIIGNKFLKCSNYIWNYSLSIDLLENINLYGNEKLLFFYKSNLVFILSQFHYKNPLLD